MIHLLAAIAASSRGASVTLSGETYQPTSSNNPTTGRFIVDQDGNMYRQLNSDARVQIDTGPNWIRPNTAAPGTYEGRYTGVTGDTGSLTATTAVNVWHSMATSDWTITVSDSDSGVGGKSCTFTLEIRVGSTTLASASYTLGADYQI